MKRFKAIVAYDGTNYCGWQIQKNKATIQGQILNACGHIFQGKYNVYGASRTDSGVHALGQVALIEASTNIPAEKMTKALNTYLPEDIIIQKVETCDDSFHPIRSAKAKTYIYKIYNEEVPLPQLRLESIYFHKKLDVEKMNEGAKYFVGEHDFVGFRSLNGQAKTTVRTIYNCSVYKKDNMINLEITGNGFLYNMVRIIAGTLLEVGRSKKAPEEIKKIIESKDRHLAGPVASAKGLTLVEIKY